MGGVAKTLSQRKRVSGSGRRYLCDCFRKLMSGSIARRSPSQTEGSIGTLDAAHEHNCCIHGGFPLNEDEGIKRRRPPLLFDLLVPMSGPHG